MQARRRWSSRPPFPPNFLSEQQNIFSKTFQFVTIKFFVFFRTNERNQNKKKNLRGCGSFAKKEEIDRHVHKLRWRNKHLSRLIYVDIWNQEYVENILFDFFVIQEMWYAIVLQTVYNEWIIFGVSFVNKWKCLIPKKKNWFFLQTREKLQQPQQQPQQQQQNDHCPTEEIQSASSDSMHEITTTYQPHQPPKKFKFPEAVCGK